MKLKYFFPSLIAAVAMLVSCSDDNDPTYLDALHVSSSYVAINVDGGSTTIDLKAKGDWAVDTVGLPKWLTIAPISGPAGEATITFSAESTLDGRTAELKINCNGKTQNINVIQGLATVSPATCAEVIAGPDSKQYRVTGVCTRIANTTYGNFYLNDGTGEIYIYGTVNASGSYAWASFGIEVGDEVTVEGPKTTYNGTVELVDATFISVNKSLIKVDSLDVEGSLPIEGGDFTVSLTCKTANGVSVEIPEDAQSWLSIVAINGGAVPTVKFHVAANNGGARSTTIVFTTTDGKKNYSSETSISQEGAIQEVTIADFNSRPDGDALYKLTGVITSIASDKYGNIYIKDATGEAYVYGTLTADGQSQQFASLGLKVGDIVTLVGPKSSYKESPQMVNGVYQEHISVTPKTVAEFRALDDSATDYYMLTGKVSKVAEAELGAKDDIAAYGNFDIVDETGAVYVYGVLPGWGGAKGQFGTLGVNYDDTITIITKKTTYKGLVEADGAFLFSHTPAE